MERLKKQERLPSAPGVALEIIKLTQSDAVDLNTIIEVLKLDPALVAKLIRTANSVLYGLPRQVTNIRQAVIVMGTRAVSLLALSFSLVPVARGSNDLGFNYKRYWTYSIATNVGANCLAQMKAPTLRDEAFLCGLLCRIGQLVLVEWAPREYGPVLAEFQSKGGSLLEIETSHLNTTNIQIASDLLYEWGLPAVLCDAIGAQHDPSIIEPDKQSARRLAEILQIATICADFYTGGDAELFVREVGRLGERYFDLDSEGLNTLLSEIERRAPEAAELYELELEDPQKLAALRAQAEELLLKKTAESDGDS
jgi:HD-like signal output (HDOD) protein